MLTFELEQPINIQ